MLCKCLQVWASPCKVGQGCAGLSGHGMQSMVTLQHKMELGWSRCRQEGNDRREDWAV